LTSVTWGLTVGSLGTWGVLQLMSAFPCCFTMGEATAVTHGFILFLMSVVTNLPLRYHLPPIHDNDISTVLLQVMKCKINCCNLFFIIYFHNILYVTGCDIICSVDMFPVWIFSHSAQYNIFLLDDIQSLMFRNSSNTLHYS